MLTRRELMAGTAGLLVAPRSQAAQAATTVAFAIPAHACDSHTHLIPDPAKYPFWPGRVYTPEPALPAEMAALHKTLGMERVVIVTPSVYGTDNSATLFGMKARGGNARGVAVIDDKTPDSELDAMKRAGIRGVRINLATGGQNDPAAARRIFETAVARVKNRRWHIEMYTTLPVIAGIKDLVKASPVPVVFDHFGGTQAGQGILQPGLPDLVELLKTGNVYVKITAPYRESTAAPDYRDVKPIAQVLVAANPSRILWGTDWPHVDSTIRPGHPATVVTPLLPIDDAKILNLLPIWVPDAAVRRQILVDNPAQLYGF